VPAVVKRNSLQIAIGTDGNCPAYAGHIREKLEKIFTDNHGQFLDELEKMREKILAEIPEANKRKIILGKLCDDKSFDYFVQHGHKKWFIYANKLLK
jgi:precorrin-2 dehydrogenase/sirohydrochlorin ferrochelatase